MEFTYLDLWRFWGFYSSVELTLVSWWRRYFLMDKIFSSVHILWDSFLVGIPQITVEHRMQSIPILGSLETTQVTWVPHGFTTWQPFGTWWPLCTWWPINMWRLSGRNMSRDVREGAWWPFGTWRPIDTWQPLTRSMSRNVREYFYQLENFL